jgi:HK97 gp10 family phage protein
MSDEVMGVEELVRNLRRMEDRAADAMEKGAQAGAKIVADAAEERAPRRSGYLGEHIVVEILEKGKNEAIAGVGPHKNAFWGLFQEMGVPQHPAQPFLRPAFDENKARAEQEMLDAIARAIEGMLLP